MKRTSTPTADDVSGNLGELTGLVRRIVAALDGSSTEPDERHVVCRRLSRTVFVAPEEPVLDWSAPMPECGTQDFSVPPPPPSSIAEPDAQWQPLHVLALPCAECNAEAGEPCRPHCIGKAAAEDTLDGQLQAARDMLSKVNQSQSTLPLPLPTAADHANATDLAAELSGRKTR